MADMSKLGQIYDEAVGLHRERRLKEASERYEQVMQLDPPRPPNGDEMARVRRLAPRLYVTPTEFFPLMDVAVVLHPDRPFIAYHVFWDDDIDYPDDSDPTDHEVVWVEYDAATAEVIGFYTFYHSHLLTSHEAPADAMAHGGRPVVYVEWGKHGSLPLDWERIDGGRWREDMQRTHQRLSRTPSVGPSSRSSLAYAVRRRLGGLRGLLAAGRTTGTDRQASHGHSQPVGQRRY